MLKKPIISSQDPFTSLPRGSHSFIDDDFVNKTCVLKINAIGQNSSGLTLKATLAKEKGGHSIS